MKHWPEYAPTEILPGLWQGGTEDDEVLGYPETDWVWWRDMFQPRISVINQELRRATKEERDLAS